MSSSQKVSVAQKNSVTTQQANANGEIRLQVMISSLKRAIRHVNTSIVCSMCWTILINLAIIITVMVLHFNNKEVTLRTSSTVLEHISQNLNSDPILEILPGNLSTGCTSDYSEIMLGIWPGLNAGCFYKGNLYSANQCGDFETDQTFYINKRNPISINDWSDSLWCVKRAGFGVDYLKLADCPVGHRQCSPGICVSTTTECPITSVTLTSSPVDSTSQTYGASHYLTVKPIGDTPLIDIDISQNGIPCFSMDKNPKGPTKPYLILNEVVKGCGRYGLDSAFSFWIDQKTEFSLLKDNNFPQEIFDLPKYSSNLKSTQSILSGRKRITVSNKDFCQSINSSVIDRVAKTVKRLNVAVSATYITAMAIHGILVLSMCCLICSSQQEVSCSASSNGKQSNEWIGFYYSCCAFVEMILYGIMVILITYFNAKISKDRGYFEQLEEESCFTEGQPVLVLQDMKTITGEIPIRFLWCSVALLVTTTISLILICGLMSYKRKIETR